MRHLTPAGTVDQAGLPEGRTTWLEPNLRKGPHVLT